MYLAKFDEGGVGGHRRKRSSGSGLRGQCRVYSPRWVRRGVWPVFLKGSRRNPSSVRMKHWLPWGVRGVVLGYNQNGWLHEYIGHECLKSSLAFRFRKPAVAAASRRPARAEMAPRSASMALQARSLGAGRAPWCAGQARLPLRRRRKGPMFVAAQSRTSPP